MSLSDESARVLLREHRLRVTAPRLAVLRALASADAPLSHSDVVRRIGTQRWDPATVFRNLVRLREAGVAVRVSHAGGQDRYTVADGGHHEDHPHFLCSDCGRVVCLPAELMGSMAMKGPWARSLRSAEVQLEGTCPACLPSG